MTLPTFFSARFSDKNGTLALISLFILLLFFTFYIASGLVGLGRLFQSAFALEYNTGVIIGLVCVLTYTMLGGFIAVAWSDLFQGIFLLCMILLVAFVAFFGKYTSITHAVTFFCKENLSIKSIFSKENYNTFFHGIFLACGWGLGYFGQPHVLTNYMGIDNPKKIAHAKYIGIAWQIIVLAAAITVGLTSICYFAPGSIHPEFIFIALTKMFFHPFLAGFVLCAVIAATLSTMDSHILISGSTIAHDWYKKRYNANASSSKIVTLSRIGSFLISLIALAIAYNNSSSVYSLVNYAWSGLGSAFGPLVIAALYTEKVTYHGALAGMITGAFVSFFWPLLHTSFLPLLPGFLSNFFILFSLSHFTQKK